MSDKLPFLLNIADHVTPEPPVQNREFLLSYIQYGCGLRVVAAHHNLQVLDKKAASPLERYSAVVGVYQNAGMLYEDIATSLLAWAIWAKDRSLYLADVYKRIALVTKSERTSIGPPNHEASRDDFFKGKRTRVQAQELLESLASLAGDQLLHFLGVPWKIHPSARLVRPGKRQEWEYLPVLVSEGLRPLGDKNNQFLGTSYNKLKHGPQIVVMNPSEVATDKRGFSTDTVPGIPSFSEGCLRILFDGARTQEHPNELADGRVAPFVLHNVDSLKNLMVSMTSAGFAARTVAWWLFRYVCQEDPPGDTDLALKAVAKANLNQMRRSGRLFVF